MRIALTGGSGGIGRAITAQALALGHQIVSIDRQAPEHPTDSVRFVQADMAEYDRLVEAFDGCDAVIHMAAIPTPGRHADHIVHNNNVVGSYNVLRAAAEHGITRLCQASSVNAIGHAYSRDPQYDYFPVDEDHPNHCEDPYSLSKWICEQQADAFVRRYADMRIASLRFHYVVPERSVAADLYNPQVEKPGLHLWAYCLRDAAARACLLSVEAPFQGHQVFYIVAPDTTMDAPSAGLAERYFPDVPLRRPLEGNSSFFSSEKAERVLGWVHPPAR